jgi:hypothetical protein
MDRKDEKKKGHELCPFINKGAEDVTTLLCSLPLRLPAGKFSAGYNFSTG